MPSDLMVAERVEIDGHGFHVLTAGERRNPVLLFLHGFPEYSGAWREVMARLSDQFFCVAPDQRGYGQSWRPVGVEHYEMPHLVADAAAIIGHFGGRVRAVVAHDWGASVAYALAIRLPDLMDRLIVMNGVHPVPFQMQVAAGGDQSKASQYIEWLRQPGSEQQLAANQFEKLMEMFSKTMDLSWMTSQRRGEYQAAWGDAAGLGAMINWYRATPLQVAVPNQPIPAEQLPQFDPARMRISMPHLLIWGMNDTALRPETRDGLKAFCDDLVMVDVAGADHWIAHQKPDLVAREIRAFAEVT